MDGLEGQVIKKPKDKQPKPGHWTIDDIWVRNTEGKDYLTEDPKGPNYWTDDG